jgi:hypothetical protein
LGDRGLAFVSWVRLAGQGDGQADRDDDGECRGGRDQPALGAGAWFLASAGVSERADVVVVDPVC